MAVWPTSLSCNCNKSPFLTTPLLLPPLTAKLRLQSNNILYPKKKSYTTVGMNEVEDVEVILGHERRYKFHSGTLARSSTLLADMLIEPNAAKLSKAAKSAGMKIRWMIELTCLPCSLYPAGRLELVVGLPWNLTCGLSVILSRIFYC